MPLPFLIGGLIAVTTMIVGYGGKKYYDYRKEEEEEEKRREREEQEKQAEKRKREFADYQRVVLLQGIKKSGKDTILHIIIGRGFQTSYSTTIKPTGYHICDIDDEKWFIVNTAGVITAADEKEKFRREVLLGIPEDKRQKKVVWLHLFDMQKFDKDDIKCKIQADHREAKGENMKFVAVGTHLDKVGEEKKKQIAEELESLGIRCFVYDMTTNPRNEILQMIKDV